MPVEVELKRPVCRYELVANDVESFLRRVRTGIISGTKFTVKVKYSDYLPVGYNVLDAVPKHSLMYMQYKKTFRLPDQGTQELTLGVDYLFVSSAGDTDIPVEIEVLDEQSVTIASSVVRIPCRQGKNTVVRGQFLTTDSAGGVGFDDTFDKEIEVDMTVKDL